MKVCCICTRSLADGENYYRIDGVRYWCIACGYQWLKDTCKGYKDRVGEALRGYREPTGTRRLFP